MIIESCANTFEETQLNVSILNDSKGLIEKYLTLIKHIMCIKCINSIKEIYGTQNVHKQ